MACQPQTHRIAEHEEAAQNAELEPGDCVVAAHGLLGLGDLRTQPHPSQCAVPFNMLSSGLPGFVLYQQVTACRSRRCPLAVYIALT